MSHEERLDSQLRSIHQRLVLRGVPATWRSPDVETIEAEERSLAAGAGRFFSEVGGDSTRLHDFRQMFTYVFARGPDPRATLQRLFAIAQALFPEMLGHMSKSDVGRMFEETKAAASWRTKQIFGEFKLTAPGARGPDTRAANAAAASRTHEKRRAGSAKRQGLRRCS